MRNLWITTVLALLLSVIFAVAADLFLSERIAILGSFAGLQYGLNPGIAWGIRLPAGLQEVLIGLALVAVGYMAYRSQQEVGARHAVPLLQIGYGLVLGGGSANIIDRLRDGYVSDFVQIGSFPIFNVADSFVTIGVGLLLVEAIIQKKQG